MKSAIYVLTVIACVVLCAGSAYASSNPGLFVPVFDENQMTSAHLSVGEKYWTWEDKDDSSNYVDYIQRMVALGINWENNVTYGFYHLRIGWVGLGDLEDADTGDISDIWNDYQDWGMYLGLGYIYTSSIPIQPDYPQGFNIFWGIGFDINGLIAAASDSTAELIFYYVEIALVGTFGFNIPEVGFSVYLNLTGNFLLDWEYRMKVEGYSASYLSDSFDMIMVPFGVEIGASYTIPSEPQLRFGLSIGLINALFVNFHIGYSFGAPREIVVHN